MPAQAKNILVTMGGGDTDNVIPRVHGALECIQDVRFEAIVAVEGANQQIFYQYPCETEGLVTARTEEKPIDIMRDWSKTDPCQYLKHSALRYYCVHPKKATEAWGNTACTTKDWESRPLNKKETE
jgi:hypothetical protein